MELFTIENEFLIRLSFFVGLLFLVAVWEGIAPRRQLSQTKWKRWVFNLGLVAMSTVLIRVAFVSSAVGFASWAQAHSFGLFNHYEFSHAWTVLFSVILLDLGIYWQHVAFHYMPLFWKLHRLHHSDLDYDVSTGGRFHPIEIFISMGLKIFVILMLGIPPLGVIIFEVLLNGTAMFNHGNIYLPTSVDRVLRYFIVTPDMHRIHHSVHSKETNSNFGFNLPWWDYLFGTYIQEPQDGQENMVIGLELPQ